MMTPSIFTITRPRETTPRVVRTAVLVAALLAAFSVPLVGATAANAASAVSQRTASHALPADRSANDPNLTWSVTPATATAVDSTRTYYDFSTKRGLGFGDRVAVTNYSSQPLTLHVYAADGTTDFKTGKLTLISGTKASKDAGSWVSVAGRPTTCPSSDTGKQLTDCLADVGVQVTVQPNTAVIVPFHISVPKNAPAGDHVAGIVAAYTVKGTGEKSIAVEERVGARIYLRVAGKLSAGLSTSGEVASFASGANPFANGSAKIGFDLTDSGNTRLSALPTFAVTGIFGIPAGTATARPVENMLPGGVAHVEATVNNVPRLLLLFGGITVTPQRPDGDVGADSLPQAAHTTAITWAVPWLTLLIVLVVGGVVGGTIWWRRRSNERLAVALHEYALQVQEDARKGELVDQAARGGDSEPPR